MTRTTIVTNRRDMALREHEAFDCLKSELTRAFASPDTSYVALTAAEVVARNPQPGK